MVSVLDATYGCTAGTLNNGVPKRVNEAKVWPSPVSRPHDTVSAQWEHLF